MKKFQMAGTEGTGKYVVIASTARGRIGVRVLEGDIKHSTKIKARIRLEPRADEKIRSKLAEGLKDWKQPDGSQDRFSTIAGLGKAKAKLALGLTLLGAGTLKTEVNPDAPSWARDLIAA